MSHRCNGAIKNIDPRFCFKGLVHHESVRSWTAAGFNSHHLSIITAVCWIWFSSIITCSWRCMRSYMSALRANWSHRPFLSLDYSNKLLAGSNDLITSAIMMRGVSELLSLVIWSLLRYWETEGHLEPDTQKNPPADPATFSAILTSPHSDNIYPNELLTLTKMSFFKGRVHDSSLTWVQVFVQWRVLWIKNVLDFTSIKLSGWKLKTSFLAAPDKITNCFPKSF